MQCEECGSLIVGRISSAVVCSEVCRRRRISRLRGIRRLKARSGRTCEHCKGPIPDSVRMGAIYCSHACYRRSNVMQQAQAGHNRRRLYGLTPDQFAAMLAAQEGRCGICRTDSPGGKGGWHVDHNHDTGTIRGLLCHRCNLGVGNFRDDSALLRRAAEYLER